MIRFILVQVGMSLASTARRVPDAFLPNKNRQGKTRLSKWYVPYDDDEKVSLCAT